MKPRRWVWSKSIEHHIALHRVTRKEVEEVFQSQPLIMKGRGQDIYIAFGRTDSGRLLIVPYVINPDKSGFVLTARDTAQKEQRLYFKKGGA